MTTTEQPFWHSASAAAAPAGPPPTIATSVSGPAVGLNVAGSLLDDKTQPMPAGDHARHPVDDGARPRNLRAAALREHIVRPLRRPPGQLPVLLAIVKVRLPRHRHLLRDISSLEERGIQAKGLRIGIRVAQQPPGFDARVEGPADA